MNIDRRPNGGPGLSRTGKHHLLALAAAMSAVVLVLAGGGDWRS